MDVAMTFLFLGLLAGLGISWLLNYLTLREVKRQIHQPKPTIVRRLS